MYSFPGNCAASVPISTFMCLLAIYIFPGSVPIFPPAEKADPSWEYIIRSQTHKSGNWDWGIDIPFLGIFAFCLCSADCKMCGLPEANVDGVLAAYGARLQEGVPALEQQHQRPHWDQEEMVQLWDLRHLQVIKLSENKSKKMRHVGYLLIFQFSSKVVHTSK